MNNYQCKACRVELSDRASQDVAQTEHNVTALDCEATDQVRLVAPEGKVRAVFTVALDLEPEKYALWSHLLGGFHDAFLQLSDGLPGVSIEVLDTEVSE